MDASPRIREFWLAQSNATAHNMVAGRTKTIGAVNRKTDATANAPKATCDSPSPINEKRLSTSVTPRSDEQSAIMTPATNA